MNLPYPTLAREGWPMLALSVAAALLTILPEVLRAVNDYRMLIYAILLIVMMIFNNSGIKTRLMEKRAARRAAKQASKEGI